jgi:hypothetical protein
MLSSLKPFWFRASRRKVVLLAAAPKSASQYMCQMLEGYYAGQFKVVRAKHSAGQGHNFLSIERVVRAIKWSRPRRHLLIYGHHPFTQANRAVLEALCPSPKVFVTIRSLPDTVVSYKEHIDKTRHGPLDPHVPGLAEGSARFAHFTDRQKHDYLIRFVLPWYIRFIAGWIEAANYWSVEFICYEQHTGGPAECMTNIAEGLGLAGRPEFLQQLRHDRNIAPRNLNRGVGGRGAACLNDDQLAAIDELLALADFAGTPMSDYLRFGWGDARCLPIRATAAPDANRVAYRRAA